MVGRRTSSAVLGGLLLASSCSSAQSSIDADPQPSPQPAAVSEVGFTAVGRIGAGRAVAAASTGVGTTVIGLTTGAVVVRDGEAVAVPTDVVSLAAVEISADGSLASVVSSEGVAEIWRISDVPELLTRVEDGLSVTFTAGGDAVVGSSSRVLSVDGRDGSTAELVSASVGGTVQEPAVADDGSWVLTPVLGVASTAALIWTSGSEELISVDLDLGPDEGVVRAVPVPGAGRVVLGVATNGGADGRLAMFELDGQTVEWSIDVESDILGSSWDVDASGTVWLATDEGVVSMDAAGPSSPVVPASDVAVRDIVASGAWALALTDGTVGLFDDSGSAIAALPTSGAELLVIESTADRSGVVTVDAVGMVREWAADGTLQAEETSYRGGRVNDVAVAPDSDRVALATSTGDVEVVAIDASARDVSAVTMTHREGNVDSVSFAPDGVGLLTGVGMRMSSDVFDDTVSVWDSVGGERRYRLGGEAEPIVGCNGFSNEVAFIPDGSLFAASSHDFVVSVWNSADGALVRAFPPHRGNVLDVAWSPSGDRLVTTADDGSVRVWSLDEPEPIAEYIAPPGGFWEIEYLRDGRLLTSDVSGAVRMFDLRDGSSGDVFEGAKLRDGGLAVSPDGVLAAGPADGDIVRVWSLVDGRPVADLVGHDAEVTAVGFTPDGRYLVSGSQDTTAIVWSVAAP